MASAYNDDVDVILEFAPGDDVFETSPTWVDITSDLREFRTTRGRSHVLDRMQAGVAKFTLNNSSGDYNPTNASGTHGTGVRVFNPYRLRVVYNSTTYDEYRGYAESYSLEGNHDQVAVVRCIDAFRLLAMFEADLTESSEFSGTRIGNLLDTAGWPASWRALDTGSHMVQALSAEFDSVLEQIHRTVLVEQGLFYISGDGTATFKDGSTLIQDKTSASATFSDDGSDVKYVDAQLVHDDAQLWNSVDVTRVGGSTQSSTSASSVPIYGERSLVLAETLHVSDGEALALAGWLRNIYASPGTRSPELVVKPEADGTTNYWATCLGLELLDRVNVERTLLGGDDFDEDCHVEGVQHEVRMVGGRSWTTTFTLSPRLGITDWWILGTSQLGTDTRLGY